MVSSFTAFLLQASFALSYVSSIYIHPSGRLRFATPGAKAGTQQTRSRDDPSVIRTRLIAVSLSTVVSCLGVLFTIWSEHPYAHDEAWPTLSRTAQLLGLIPVFSFHHTHIVPYLLVPLLYIGPLYSQYLWSKYQRPWSFRHSVWGTVANLQGVRNFVIGPTTEELVFRSCMISIGLISGVSSRQIIFLTPLWFGIAHAHHAWEIYNNLGRTLDAAKRALGISLFQLAYTTLFGWFTSYLFLRSRSAYAVIFSHIFCNVMGLPTIPDDLQRFPTHTPLIWATHVLGIAGFAFALSPWSPV